jgi:hypothetical protein
MIGKNMEKANVFGPSMGNIKLIGRLNLYQYVNIPDYMLLTKEDVHIQSAQSNILWKIVFQKEYNSLLFITLFNNNSRHTRALQLYASDQRHPLHV